MSSSSAFVFVLKNLYKHRVREVGKEAAIVASLLMAEMYHICSNAQNLAIEFKCHGIRIGSSHSLTSVTKLS